ncbi:MAG: GPW/gp25 family protein [Pseudonocardiaceae bacterium]
MGANPEFLGAGWAFPLRTDPTGSIALVSQEREVAESIRIILGTAPGERPMRPDFGCAIHDLVFAPADATTAGQLAYHVREALDRWEPRIDLQDVTVHFDAVDAGTLLIDIRYTLRNTNDPRNLVFPFYVIGSHESLPEGGA